MSNISWSILKLFEKLVSLATEKVFLLDASKSSCLVGVTFPITLFVVVAHTSLRLRSNSNSRAVRQLLFTALTSHQSAVLSAASYTAPD